MCHQLWHTVVVPDPVRLLLHQFRRGLEGPSWAADDPYGWPFLRHDVLTGVASLAGQERTRA